MQTAKTNEVSKGIRGLFAKLVAAKKPVVVATEPVDGGLSVDGSDALVQRHHREFAWSITQNRCLTASLAVNGLMVGAVLLAAGLAANKPSWMIRGAESPMEAAENSFHVTTCDKDVFRQFAQATLPVLNTADKQGSARVELLHGIVAESIIAQKTQQFSKRLKVYQDCDITQTLIVDGVMAIWQPGNKIPGSDKAIERQRFGFYVTGRLVVHVAKSPQGERFIGSDYRALLVVEQSVPNNANPYPFFLASLEERKGEAVPAWDDQFLSNPDQSK